MLRRNRPSISSDAILVLAVLLASACGTFKVDIEIADSRGTHSEPTAVGPPISTHVAPTPSALPVTPPPTAKPSAVTTVAVTPDGAVWYSFGLRTWPPQGGGGVKRRMAEVITHFGLGDQLPDENVQVLKVAPDGVLWAAAGRHVATFNGQAWEVIELVSKYIKGIVLDITFARDGAVWIASPYELVRFDGHSCTVHYRMVHALAVAPDGSIWAAGWEGLQDSALVARFDGTDWTTHSTIEQFGEGVGSIGVTPDGLVWGSTAQHGMVCFDGEGWKEYTTADGLPSNHIIDVGVAPDGLLWAATDHGVAYWEGSAWVKVDDVPRWIRAMAFASDGSIWFGGATGSVERYEPAHAPKLPWVPPPTETASSAQILSFEVTPAEIYPGDTVTLTWEAHGDRATICPSARFVLFAADDCWKVRSSGTLTFSIPQETAGFPSIDFVLTVEVEGSASAEVWQASVQRKCDRTWFFSDEPQAGFCPSEPVRSEAAVQRFERGTMVWMQNPGRYIILEDTPTYWGDVRKRVQFIDDPLEIIRDSSAEHRPPEGFYAPESGFGLVWRGDVSSSPGCRTSLGWALTPESRYEAIFQCDDAQPSGGRSWQTCYLEGPDGEVFAFHPLGGWYLLAEQGPGTSPTLTPTSPVGEVRWDTSPATLVVRYYSPNTTAGLAGAYDRRYYVPEVQAWGDGRVIWVARELESRRVLEGRLTIEQMGNLLRRIVDAGFFAWEDRYCTLGGTSFPFRHLALNLLGQSKEVSEHGGAPKAFYDLVEFLKGGAGAEGHDYAPELGYLTVESLGPVGTDEGTNSLKWPDDAAGFTLDEVGDWRYIGGEALAFAWHAVNQYTRAPVYVESKGQLYTIMVQIPGLSYYEPPTSQ